MAQIVVRNIDEKAFAQVKVMARKSGRSTEAFVRSLIEREARANTFDPVAESDRLRAMTPKRLSDSSVDIIRALRDEADVGH